MAGVLSIVTATRNCSASLPTLIAKLRAQTDRGFEWIVADAGSTDGTVEQLLAVSDMKVVMSSQQDFGIYDGINRALKLSTGSHYVVMGSDDLPYPDAVENYKRAISASNADIVAARVMYGPRCVRVRSDHAWLHGPHSYISNHSLASAFRKDLHDKFGLYSRKYPLAADALFVLKACGGGASRIEADFIAGEMGQAGISAVDWAGSATEFFRVQIATGRGFALQALLLNLRLIKGASPGAKALFNRLRR